MILNETEAHVFVPSKYIHAIFLKIEQDAEERGGRSCPNFHPFSSNQTKVNNRQFFNVRKQKKH